MEKGTKKLKNERDTAVRECNELKARLSAVLSELETYKRAEKENRFFSRDKLKKVSKRITREDELSDKLKKAAAFISAYGLSEDFARYKYNKSRDTELE